MSDKKFKKSIVINTYSDDSHVVIIRVTDDEENDYIEFYSMGKHLFSLDYQYLDEFIGLVKQLPQE